MVGQPRRCAARTDRSARSRKTRRRCRTAPRPSAAGSTSEPQPDTASRASVRRSMIFEVEPGLGRDPVAEIRRRWRRRGRPPWRSAGRAATVRWPSLSAQTFSAADGAVHRRLATAGRCADSPSPSRTIREKASIDPELARRAGNARPTGGNCWCRGQARQTPADRDCGAAAAAPAWRAAGPEARRAPALGAAAVPHRRGEARPAPRQRRHGRGRTLCGRGDVCGACARAAVRRRRATHGERPLRKVRRDRRPAAPPSRSAHCG